MKSLEATGERVVAFAGQSLRVRSPAPEVGEALDFLFSPHLGSASKDDVPELVVHREDDSYRLTGTNDGQPSVIASELLDVMLSQVVPQRLVAPNATHLMLHAAALERNGQGLLFVASAGCGKTTLTAWLLGQGYRYLTDELVAVDEDGFMRGLARPLNIKASGLPLVQRFPWLELDLSRARTSGQVTLVAREDPCLIPIPVSVVVFPRFTANTTLRFEQLTIGQCAAHLMGSLVNARNLPKHGLSMATALARQAPAYALSYGHLAELLPWLARLRDDDFHTPTT